MNTLFSTFFSSYKPRCSDCARVATYVDFYGFNSQCDLHKIINEARYKQEMIEKEKQTQKDLKLALKILKRQS